jgi:TolB-like protein/Tfp pilus assembly protein PilF
VTWRPIVCRTSRIALQRAASPSHNVRVDAQPGMDQPLRFGSFELDIRSRELRKGKTRIRLQEQPFEILRMMLERPGHVVTREELCRRLWPDGTYVDYEHSLNAAVKRLRAALGDDADNPRFVETLPRRGYRFIAGLAEDDADEAGGTASPGGVPRVRLAVLPFSNLSEEGGHEYFTDGLTEEMIAQLGQRCRGRVGILARWSSMMFRGTKLRAREVGQALNADYLLEGSVRREGDQVRITARLIEAAGETQLWSESYQRHMTDCLSLQADVSARIAQSLATELAPDAAPRQQGTNASQAAYQEYLKGRYHWNKLDDEREGGAATALGEALTCFGRAIDREPGFAEAHAISARVHIARAQQYLEPPRPLLERARDSVKQALALQPGVAEAHLALGDVRRMLEWDWRGAEQAYTQAIALNPSAENAHRRYSLMLAVTSRTPEAFVEAERACEHDPLCLVVLVNAALVRYLSGDYDAAIARAQHILEMGPQYLPARRLLGAAFLQAGRTADALAALDAAAEAADSPIALAWLAHARAASGDRAGADRCLDRLGRMARTRYVSPYHLALARAGTGDIDEAFALLEHAVTDADPALAYVGVEPRLEPLRGDPRYARLVDLLGL